MSGDRGLLCCARIMTGHSSGWLEKTPDSDVAERKTRSRLGFGGARGMVGGADWASNWGAGEAPRVCVSEVMLREPGRRERMRRAGPIISALGEQ